MNKEHVIKEKVRYHLGRGANPRFHIQTEAGYQIASTTELSHHPQADEENAMREANAELIAEAFNVLHETGMTPRELAEQKADLLRTLNMAVNCLRVCHQELHEAGCDEAADDTYRDILAYMDTLSKYEPAK